LSICSGGIDGPVGEYSPASRPDSRSLLKRTRAAGDGPRR